MERNESLFIAEFHGHTTIHPLALFFLIVMVVILLRVERRSAVAPFLILACFVAVAQRVVIFGLDFNMIRILVVFGWIRLLVKGETSTFEMKPVDWVIIMWAVTGAIAYTVLRGSSQAFVYKLGSIFDSLGMYFLFRCLVRDWEDIKYISVILAYLSIPVVLFFLYEKLTGINVFSIFGGVPEYTKIRGGKLRAQGAFVHPIIAGSFWATQIPIIATLWWDDRRRLAIIGVICSLVIVIASASSTPLAGIFAILVGVTLYHYWSNMRTVWRAFLLLLFLLHMVMEGPVWSLISKIDFVGGSTGYHRYQLINQAINHFDEWWLMGVISSAHWGWDMFDTANQYINTGKHGGILTLILFVTIISLTFKSVGMLLIKYNEDVGKHAKSWALGLSLFAHCTVFIGVSYFGQINVVWYLLLAMIASLSPYISNAGQEIPSSSDN